MIDRITQIIDGLIEREGSEYTNDPNDSGGPTKYGITIADLSEFYGRPASSDEVRNMSRDTASGIYRDKYITKPGFGSVMALSQAIGEELIDTGVNCGVSVACMFLQRCLNAFNRRGVDYPDISVDGQCGAATRVALKAYLAKRGKEGEAVMLKALNALQGARYVDLAEKRPKDEDFVYGWIKNRA